MRSACAAFVPSMTKSGQIRSSVVRWSRERAARDHSARRFAAAASPESRTASGACALLPPARFARSVRNETALSLGDATSFRRICSPELAASYHLGPQSSNRSRRTWFAVFAASIRRWPCAAAPSCRNGNGPCGRRWPPAQAPCRRLAGVVMHALHERAVQRRLATEPRGQRLRRAASGRGLGDGRGKHEGIGLGFGRDGKRIRRGAHLGLGHFDGFDGLALAS